MNKALEQIPNLLNIFVVGIIGHSDGAYNNNG
jgi:hypothetical protein